MQITELINKIKNNTNKLNQLLLNELRTYRQRPVYSFGTGFTN